MANPDGIDIDDTDGPPGYKVSIWELLSYMVCDPVAALLFALIGGNRHDMTIRPYTKGDAGVYSKDNAFTTPKHSRDAHPEGVFYHLSDHDNPLGRVKGTGEGSDVEIHFTPSAASGPGSAPDESLFHEMVHGLRMICTFRD